MALPTVKTPSAFSSSAETPLSRLTADRADFITKVRKRLAGMGEDASSLTDDQLIEGAARRLPEASRYLASPVAPTANPDSIKRQMVSDMNRLGASMTAGGLRTVTGLLGNAPLAGALVAGGGELGAELLEARAGLRKDLNWDQMLVQAGLGAIPGGKLAAKGGLLGKTLMSGTRGGIVAGAGDAMTQYADGEPIDYERVAKATGTGMLVGGALGAFGARAQKPTSTPPTLRPGQTTLSIGPDGMPFAGGRFPSTLSVPAATGTVHGPNFTVTAGNGGALPAFPTSFTVDVPTRAAEVPQAPAGISVSLAPSFTGLAPFPASFSVQTQAGPRPSAADDITSAIRLANHPETARAARQAAKAADLTAREESAIRLIRAREQAKQETLAVAAGAKKMPGLRAVVDTPAPVAPEAPQVPPRARPTPTTQRPVAPSPKSVTRYIALTPEEAAIARTQGFARAGLPLELRPSDIDDPGKVILAVTVPEARAGHTATTGPLSKRVLREIGHATSQEDLIRFDIAEEGMIGAEGLLDDATLRNAMEKGRIFNPNANDAELALRERWTPDGESGQLAPDAAMALGGAAVGGLTGAATGDDEDSRLTRGLFGAIAGAGVGAAAGKKSTLPALDPQTLRHFAESIPREAPSRDRNIGRMVQAGLMLSPKVHTANLLSNSANAAFGNFAQPFKAAASAAQGDMAPARGLGAFYGAIPQGVRNGLDDAAFAWRAGFGKQVGEQLAALQARGLQGEELATEVRRLGNQDVANVGGSWRSPLGRLYESGSRAAGAADAFFSAIAREQNRAGLLAGGADATTANAVAGKRALESTFQEDLNPNGLTQRLMTLRGDGAGKVFMPFMKTPSNVARQGIQGSPLAPLSSEWRDLARGGGQDGANAIGNALAGSTLLGGAVLGGARLTGGYPASQKERQELAASERSPNSFGVEGEDGTTWVPNNLLGRMSVPLSLVGAGQDALRSGELDLFDLAARGGSTLLDAHPLGSASQNLEALAGGDAAALRNFARRTAENMVPGIGALRAISDVIDPTVRDAWRTTGPAPSLYSIAEALGLDAPFAPPKLDLTGRAKEKHGLGEGALGKAAVGFMPRVTTTPAGRLQDIEAFREQRLSIAPPPLGVLQRQYPDADLLTLSRIQTAMQKGAYDAVQAEKNPRKARSREQKRAAREMTTARREPASGLP